MKQFYYFILTFSLLGISNIYCQNLEAKFIELYFANDSNPSELVKAESGFYFTAIDAFHGRELWFSDGTPENTRMVKDIYEGDGSSEAFPIAVIGDLLFFTAHSNSRSNPQLWVSNGTEEGTYPIKENPVYKMFIYKGKAYFTSSGGEKGYELWVSDGTSEGTKLFKDIWEGQQGSWPESFFEFEGSLFFTANDGKMGRELWKSDGTPAGTSILKDINPNNDGIYSNIEFLEYNGDFYFMADDNKIGFELYKSNGTEEGTVLVKDIHPNGSSSTMLQGTVTEEGIFFSANDGQNGYELWKSNGTEEGTVMVKNITLQGDTFKPFISTRPFTSSGNTVFFVANDGVNGVELWKTDGTEESTTIVKQISPGSNSTYIRQLKSYAGKVLFVASENVQQKSQLWITDGSDSGTFPLSEVDITTDLSSFNFKFLEYGHKVFFVANSNVYGHELWVTDGTVDRTGLFKDLNHRWGSYPQNFLEINGLLYFSARKYSSGNNLFISNGTSDGTDMVKVINSSGFNSMDEDAEMIALNDNLIFSVSDGVHGRELWISDGTGSGTQMLKDIYPGSNSSIPGSPRLRTFSAIGDKMYFMANDGVHGYELWVSDGTPMGTKMVKDVNPGGQGSNVSYIVSANNTIYFSAIDPTGPALWKSDGTNAGTVKVKNFHGLRRISVVNNKVIFTADLSNSSYGAHDLFSSDGTAEGTIHLQKFGSGSGGDIELMTVLNDELYFIAKNPETFHAAIFKTDGTIEGTKLLKDAVTIGINPKIDAIRTCGDYVYFVVEKENKYNGSELWRTAGSPETTIQLTSTELGTYNHLNSLTCFQDELYFNDLYSNHYIWKTDGSVKNTNKVSFNVEGNIPPDDLRINNLFGGKNVLYIVADSQEHGEELFAIHNGEIAALPVDETPEKSISTDIFSIKINSETCANKNNGSLFIEAIEEHPFVVSINNKVYNFTKDFYLENLTAGDYSVCITIDSRADFEQCFEFTIESGISLDGAMQSMSRPDGTLVNININKGTAPFLATLDGKFIGSYNSSEFTVLADSKGTLEITSGKACEGKLTLNILDNPFFAAFPNPTTDFLNIAIPGRDLQDLPVSIYNGSGQLISSGTFATNNQVLSIKVENLVPGIYYAVLEMKTPHTIQFIKQ